MSVREATADDIPALIQMGLSMREESPRFRRFTPDFKQQEAVLLALIQSPEGLVLIGDGAMFVGHINTPLWYSDRVACEELLFVMPEKRGGPAAFRMIRWFERWAKGRGAVEVNTGITVAHHVDETSRLYRKMGYADAGVTFRKEL